MPFYKPEEIEKYLTEDAIRFKPRLTRWMRKLVGEEYLVGATAALEVCAILQAIVQDTAEYAVQNAALDGRKTIEVDDIICGYDKVKTEPVSLEETAGGPVLYFPVELFSYLYKDDAQEIKRLLKRRGVLAKFPDVDTIEWRSRKRKPKAKPIPKPVEKGVMDYATSEGVSEGATETPKSEAQTQP